MHRSGIYLIKCTPKGRLPFYYVGQSIDISRRLKQHRADLRGNRHANPRMQRYWNAHGSESFVFEPLNLCLVEELDCIEEWWLDEIVGYHRCFNVGTKPTATNHGRKFSEAHRRRIADGIRGEKHYLFGKCHTDETKIKISLSGRGLKRSIETRQKISSANAGMKNSMYGKTGSNNAKSKPVKGISLEDGSILKFESACLAKSYGFDQGAISRCCSNKSKSHNGYTWSYVT